MDCERFEEQMSRHFAVTDAEVIKAALYGAGRTPAALYAACGEHSQEMIRHLEACDDCQCCVLQYIEIRELVNYHDYPCFHLAYYATSPAHRCIEHDGCELFLIPILGSSDSVCIGFCPWCGREYPTSFNDRDEVKRIGLKAWRDKRRSPQA